jgi:heavy metal sensor kinase
MASWLSRLERLPIRVRLTIAFAAVMAAVLTTMGVLLYATFGRDLNAEIDEALRTQATDIAALVEGGRDPDAIVASGERLAQIYAADGRLLASTPDARGLRLLSTARVREAAEHPLRIDRVRLRTTMALVRAIPARRPEGFRAVVAVADSLERRDRALGRLRTLLIVAAPGALLLASLAGYEVARAALRPVDRMRRQADRITEGRLSERLTLPAAEDEIGALGRTLNALLGRVEAAVARERRVVSDASHELRTPLTTLRAEVDLALRGNRDAGELRAALESAAEEAERMTRLADDLLVLARADQGRLPLNREHLAAGELLTAAAGRANAATGAAGREIRAAAGAADGAVVVADRDRVIQALDNLIGNSLRYGGGAITLRAELTDGFVELHVADEGPGFPDGLAVRAFERFARGDQARASGSGSGLGLAIVDAIARAHGGRAGARNRTEGGADVWIALPSDEGRD